MDLLKIGSRLELFCDDWLLDTARTDARRLLHTPVRRDTVMINDEPWEGNVSNYFNLFYDEDHKKYRMYYKSGKTQDTPAIKTHRSSRFCYAESEDGITWTKPDLGLWGHTNIVTRDLNIDNFFVLKDDNLRCPADERYKAFCGCGTFWYYASPDGIHFDLDRGRTIMKRGAGHFDSLNTVRWSEELGKYICFFRASRYPDGSFPDGSDDWSNLKECVRGIMYCASEDLIHWDEPIPFEYSDNRVFEMYTNCACRYYRAPHIYTAMPTRYVQRRSWNVNYDELGGREARLDRFRNSEAGRGGLAVTEALFMSSRNGIHWTRYPEAFLRPGPQTDENWLYGGGYPAVGMIETISAVSGADNELSIYVPEGRSSWRPNELIRHTLRLDGFVSMHADIEPKRVMTKPLIYTGDDMVINFSTSAYGFIQIKIKDDHNNELVSPELFGDSTKRKTAFFNGKAGELSGIPVIVEITMSDADLYSVRFL